MERKLKTALLNTIEDYNAIVKQINDPTTPPARKLELITAKEALQQVLQNFADAEYVENIDGKWRIKVIVIMEHG